jgi:hypothetical protein
MSSEDLFDIHASCTASTKGAIKVNLKDKNGKDRELWIPQSQVHDDSEVYAKGHTGKLVISMWLAEKEGLI